MFLKYYSVPIAITITLYVEAAYYYYYYVILGNLPVERAKDAVCFFQRCGVSLVSSYAVCFLQRGGVVCYHI